MNHFPEKEEGPENYVDNLFEDNHHQRRRITTSRGYEFRWRRGPEFISSQYINEVYIGGWPSYPQIVEFRNPSKKYNFARSMRSFSQPIISISFMFFPNDTKIYPFGYIMVTSKKFGSVFNLSQFD